MTDAVASPRRLQPATIALAVAALIAVGVLVYTIAFRQAGNAGTVEANGVAAGLWMTGEPVIVMIQHAGLYASVNTLRGISMDGRIPIFYMIGLLSREPDKDPLESKHSMVRYAEPLLDLFGVPHARLEGPDDVKHIPAYYRMSRERRGPAAVLVGLPTS